MFNLPTISESFDEAMADAKFAERIREEDQLPASYGKTFEEFYGLPPREEIVEEIPKPKAEIARAHVRVIPSEDILAIGGDVLFSSPKREILMPWSCLNSLAKVEEMIRGLDLSEWGYMSEHWQGKSKFYLRLYTHDGTTLYRVSEITYEIIRDRYDRAREFEEVNHNIVELDKIWIDPRQEAIADGILFISDRSDGISHNPFEMFPEHIKMVGFVTKCEGIEGTTQMAFSFANFEISSLELNKDYVLVHHYIKDKEPYRSVFLKAQLHSVADGGILTFEI
jgi:hypothetical protein